MDLSLRFERERFEFDLALDGGPVPDLQGDDGLLTAIVVSLFSDAPALAGDPLPDVRVGVPSDRRGWWGDGVTEADARAPLGSRLWLLSREKEMEEVVSRAQQYAEEALRWLVDGEYVATLTVTASRVGPAHLGIDVRAVPMPGTGERAREWRFVFDYINAAPVRISAPGA